MARSHQNMSNLQGFLQHQSVQLLPDIRIQAPYMYQTESSTNQHNSDDRSSSFGEVISNTHSTYESSLPSPSYPNSPVTQTFSDIEHVTGFRRELFSPAQSINGQDDPVRQHIPPQGYPSDPSFGPVPETSHLPIKNPLAYVGAQSDQEMPGNVIDNDASSIQLASFGNNPLNYMPTNHSVHFRNPDPWSTANRFFNHAVPYQQPPYQQPLMLQGPQGFDAQPESNMRSANYHTEFIDTTKLHVEEPVATPSRRQRSPSVSDNGRPKTKAKSRKYTKKSTKKPKNLATPEEHRCEPCQRVFKLAKDLTRHLQRTRRHQETQPPQYRCDRCPHFDRRLDNFRRHVQGHSDIDDTTFAEGIVIGRWLNPAWTDSTSLSEG